MKFKKTDPIRKFKPCGEDGVEISDCAHVKLEPDEQITIKIDNAKEFDVVRKDWGFYATPSLNGRLPRMGLRPALVKNEQNYSYLWLIEKGKEALFEKYLKNEKYTILIWLDTEEAIQKGIVNK